MILGSVPAAAVAAWLGHGDGGVLALRTYGRARSDDLKGVAAIFARPEAKPALDDAAS
ncbi:hypothetical protein TPB0596_44700 [Tsukamurella pulmonis]|uniref:hypothetical protein n=1 Tax=Tsukamurella pulmonis TaxID=47312 RepID=UPI001EDF8F51|nr:hypothetical protein [Tsukamurella pulmonis]BDD84707.1 hypothetical protein TPB0596_44700 [Tsukamurella pulmonis]